MKKKVITHVSFERYEGEGKMKTFYSILVHRGRGHKNVRHYTCHNGSSMLKWMKKLNQLWIEAG